MVNSRAYGQEPRFMFMKFAALKETNDWEIKAASSHMQRLKVATTGQWEEGESRIWLMTQEECFQ